MIRIIPIEELAEDAFLKAERLKALQVTNTPQDFDERKKLFVEMALARKAAVDAENLLTTVIGKRRSQDAS